MKNKEIILRTSIALCTLVALSSCGSDDGSTNQNSSFPGANPAEQAAACQLVPSGPAGPAGTTVIHTQALVTGLEAPWEIAFLPGSNDWLLTERPGRLRLVQNGVINPTPVMTLDTVQSGEGGLLGLALDPSFSQNLFFYIFYSATNDSSYVNRVQRYKLSADHTTATPDQVILDGITWNSVHNGGRIKFGPDGKLYISTGEGSDATLPENSQSLNGKILRINSDGSIPSDNPEAGLAWWVKGLRNPQSFDWINSSTLAISDNGPTGEYQGRTGGDKFLVAQKGQDMGWPTIWHCETQDGLISPRLTWTDAVPPGGTLLYTGNDIPQWKGNILIGSTGGQHLHRIILNSSTTVVAHEVYLDGTLGRLRSVIQGPNGELYIMTSNCDSRGTCPAQKDGIYRVLAGS